jgi:NADPH-dependent 2,4-dienoyl-CoA reductase/sulfur reductase-like enzyme
VPFAGNLGQRIGRRIQAEHQKHGVNFRLGTSVQALEGDQAVRRVVLQDGTALDADLVVIGIGVTPATDFLHGFELADDGSIRVDAYLQAGNGVYAAGDMARFPDWRTGKSIRIEHWRLACQHGRLAGANAAGRSIPYRSLPFFWTVQFDLTLNYVGHAEGWDDIIYRGEVEGEQWIAYYVKDDAIRAAVGANCDRDMAVIHELMRRELLPAPEAWRQGAVDLVALLRAAGV